MILRRFTEALKEQNWTTILVEFVLLVAGVFLGIQAANWNETRRDHAQEAEFIGRLQRDFHAIDARLTRNLSRWQEKASSSVRLLADLEAFQQRGAWPRPKQEILRDLENTMNGAIPAPRAATYVELLSAGKLGLIRDTRLRDALLDYDVQTGFTMKAYDVLVQRTDPHMVTIVAHLEFDRNIPSKALSEVALRSTRNIDDSFVDVDLARLSADPELKVALNMFAVSSSNQLRVAVLQQQKARAVTAMLDPASKHTEGMQP